MERITIKEYELESKVFDLLNIDLDLFTYDTPLEIIFDEFKRLSSIEDDLFAYELGVLEDSNFPCFEQPYDNLKNDDLDWLHLKFGDHRTVDKEIVESVKRGDDEEVLTDDELSNLEKEDLREDNEIAEIDVDVLTGDLPRFKTYEDYKNAWIYKWNKEVPWNYEWYEGPEDSDLKEEALKEKPSWKDHGDMRIEKERTFALTNQEWFDGHELMDDDDDIGDLDDYLIPNNTPYYVDEEEERFKEKRSKLLVIPYEKPPTFKSEKFEVIKYSLGPAKEYVSIKEYDI
ncbi:hypothetical protein Tco_1025949 [Tanacetum coccineum]